MPTRLIQAVCAALLIVGSGVSHASDAWMATAGSVLAPAGFREFCQRTGAACAVAGRSALIVRLSVEELRALERFNQKFNSSIQYRPDHAVYGVSDYWDIADETGDCEDIALAKRAVLIAAGWPAAALWLAIGKDSVGQAHVVLVVRSNQGDLVLDNRVSGIALWHQTPLRWIARQVPGDSRYWRLLNVRP